MNAPDAAVLAYRETRDTVVREYPLRLVVSAGVAWIIAETGALSTAVVWWLAIAALLGLEALAYRRVFRKDRRVMPARLIAMFAAISVVCAIVYTLPVWLMIRDGSPSLVFAAAAFMAGTLIHLTAHNANTRLIYAAPAAPMTASFVAAGVHLAIEAGNLIPVLTVALFVSAMIAAYWGRLKSIRQINDAMAEALKGREAAQQASAAKSQFLAKMSHEFRTPLNGILGMAETLRAGESDPARREQIETVIRSGEALDKMLNAVLDHAMIESGGLKFDPHEEDIGEIVEEAAAAFRPAATQKGVALAYDGSGLALRRLRLDRKRLRQALAHIIGNAVKFTDSGAILVKARTSPDKEPGKTRVEIIVSDTGLGMTAEECARVFEPFEQADNSFTRRFGGAGLGLSLARGMALAAGGDISVRSAPGAGTTVALRFAAEIAETGQTAPPAPAPQKSAPAPQKSAPAPHSSDDDAARSGRVRILLVEDNPVNRQVVRALLSPLNVEIEEAENGAEGLKRLGEGAYDLVLMDLHMPVMDGFAATRAIRRSDKAWARVPVVALTAAASPEDRAASLDAGMNDFLSKPVKAAVLAEAIRRYVGLDAGPVEPEAAAG